MKSEYIYLIAQLPWLSFGAKPPLSFDKFLALSRQFISEKDADLLSSLPQSQDYAGGEKRNSALRQWVDFDTALRNDLVRIRSSRKHVDPSAYLRAGGMQDPGLMHVAAAAQRNPSPLEAERLLDETRWSALDELEAGHFFDLEILVIYAYKLMILIRWEQIGSADKEKMLEETLAKT
ncbi:MAG: hypothetical protein WC723_02570 [Candidatus Omnitrophota bacterium]